MKPENLEEAIDRINYLQDELDNLKYDSEDEKTKLQDDFEEEIDRLCGENSELKEDIKSRDEKIDEITDEREEFEKEIRQSIEDKASDLDGYIDYMVEAIEEYDKNNHSHSHIVDCIMRGGKPMFYEQINDLRNNQKEFIDLT